MYVIVAGLLPVGAWGNHRRHAPLQNVLAKPLGVIPLVSQHILTCITVDQPLGRRDVVLLSSSQDEAQGIAQTIHAPVDLGAEPTAAPSQGLGCLATFLGRRSRGAGVGPDHRAVDDAVFHIRVVGQMLQQQFPDTPVAPAGESFVDAVPFPILGWKEPPLGAGAIDPQDGFYKTSAFCFLTDLQFGATTQELEKLSPFIWREFKS